MRRVAPLEDCPLDQYSRYRACAEALKRLAARGATVLDCGSGLDCLLERFLPDFQVTCVDPLLIAERSNAHERIAGSVFHPALDGRTFDFVVTIDTLEHVPPAQRGAFLDRVSELARHGLFIACPCEDAGEAWQTDRYVNEVYQFAFGQPYPWLAEHFTYGLPRLEDIVKRLRLAGWHLFQGQNGHTPWLRKLLAFLLCAMNSPALRAAATEVSRRFNQELYEFDHQPPGYRQIVVALRDRAGRDDPLPAPSPEMPPEALRRWEALEQLTLAHSARAMRRTRGVLREVASFLQTRLADRVGRVLDRSEQFFAQTPLSAGAKWQLKRAWFATLGYALRHTPHYTHYLREQTWRKIPPFRPDRLPAVPPPSQPLDVLLWAGTRWESGGHERNWADTLSREGLHVLYIEPEFAPTPVPGFEVSTPVGNDSVARVRLNLKSPVALELHSTPPAGTFEQLRCGIGNLLASSASRQVVCVVAHRFWLELALLPPNSRLVLDRAMLLLGETLSERERHLLARAELLVGSADSDTAESTVARLAAAPPETGPTTASGRMTAELLLSATEPRVSVIVVTYANLEVTRCCLASIESESDYSNLELVVVDNASADGTREHLQRWASSRPNVRILLNSENRGFPAAVNQGLGAATGDYLVLLNNDTHVTAGWVRTLLNHLRNDPTIGLIGPVTNAIGNEARIPVSYRDRNEMAAIARAWCLEHLGHTFSIRTLAFFCAMMPRHVHDRVGPLDEGFGIGFFEDDDYCRRVEQLGYRIVCAEDVFVHHEMSASFDVMTPRVRREIFEASRRRYESKWGAWTPPGYRSRAVTNPRF
jgi:GT2 family glycosyltransferase